MKIISESERERSIVCKLFSCLFYRIKIVVVMVQRNGKAKDNTILRLLRMFMFIYVLNCYLQTVFIIVKIYDFFSAPYYVLCCWLIGPVLLVNNVIWRIVESGHFIMQFVSWLCEKV